MKVLFLTTNIGYGGASKMIVWVANQCALVGYDVTILTYRDDDEKQTLFGSVRHVHFSLEHDNGLGGGIFSTILFLRKYIKSNSFDVAVAFLPPSQIRLTLSCIGLKTKLLYSQRGDPYQRKSSIKMRVAEFIGNYLFSFADYYVFQTIGAKKYYPKAIQRKSVVIPNPINRIERTLKREGNIENKIVCVARLDLYQKRQDVLIEAFILIEDKYPDLCLELYGDGSKDDANRLRRQSQNHRRIKFMGKLDEKEIVHSIQNAALAVLSSDFEGIPNALLEYMSLGIPSISTDCSPGGAAMIINNGVNGLLVPRDDPQKLADAMSFMLSNFNEAEAMGLEGMKVIDTFSEKKIKSMWIDCFERL